MMKIAIITSGFLPVPATKGGAVEAIIDNFIDKNEEFKKVEFDIFSTLDDEAYKRSKKYKNTKFYFKKVNIIAKFLDNIIYWIAKNILKKDKVMSYRYIVQRIDFLNKVSKQLKKEEYDKILLENNSTLFLALKWRKNYIKYKGKYYLHLHNEVKSYYGCEEIIKKCRKILCVSGYIKKRIEEQLEINGDNVEILNNCIDINKFSGNISEEEKKKIKNKYDIKETEKVLLFAGRLSKEKGIKELLEAIEMVKCNDSFKLLIVGSFFYGTQIRNKFEEELEKIINRVKDKVVFTGFIPYDEIHKIYAIADIAVLPSIWDDPAPLTIIESMASGLPIITTKSGGIPEYAKNGCAIVLGRSNNLTIELKKAIENLLEDDTLRAKMSKISLENAKVLNLDSFYDNLLKNMEV